MSPEATKDSSLFPKLFQPEASAVQYRKIGQKGLAETRFGSRNMLTIDAAAITLLVQSAFADVSHLLRPAHLHQVRKILDDTESSANDRFVAMELLKNAVISAQGKFPSCQDTGTAIVLGKKGENVLVDGNLHDAICQGIVNTWQIRNLRFSQMAPVSMYVETNTGTNMPAQIEIEAVQGDSFEFLFIAKGGGSANKTFLFQETKRLLDRERLLAFCDEKIRTIGTTACPPYHLVFVIGGLSADQTLKTVKLASTKELDDLPTTGDQTGRAFRDLQLEGEVLKLTQDLGMGAQFGGKHFCHDVRVIRLPRHGGSLPVGMGVSCSADRQIKGRIDQDGIWLEQLETNPENYLPETEVSAASAKHINLDQPMPEILKQLSQLQVADPVLLSGTMIVARDLVHAELAKKLVAGQPLPDYFRDFPIYYAGPAKTPEGHASGSFGPTTAARMDPYIADFQAAGGSLVMIAKGNRSQQVMRSCNTHGGFYLGSVGGTAAVLGRDVITHVETLDYDDFGMEAVFKITVKNFPAFLIIDDKGNDFFTVKPALIS
ncbi:MAG: fumarate hydratase C-terminal domain-containing protein [Rhodobacteraceae bacterium]|nr:fumarate hydratase C-terminal domain-containing protein [Paracoccaceae bacterium]